MSDDKDMFLVPFNTGEHKHSGFEVLNSGGANACPICQAQELSTLRKELEEARKVNEGIMATKTIARLHTTEQERDSLKRRLEESEASRERMRAMLKTCLDDVDGNRARAIKLGEDVTKFFDTRKAVKELLSEPPPHSLEEAP